MERDIPTWIRQGPGRVGKDGRVKHQSVHKWIEHEMVKKENDRDPASLNSRCFWIEVFLRKRAGKWKGRTDNKGRWDAGGLEIRGAWDGPSKGCRRDQRHG